MDWVGNMSRPIKEKKRFGVEGGVQPPDAVQTDGSNYVFKKSGKRQKINISHWSESWYEKGKMWSKLYIVVM
jgi:hypothetical protein